MAKNELFGGCETAPSLISVVPTELIFNCKKSNPYNPKNPVHPWPIIFLSALSPQLFILGLLFFSLPSALCSQPSAH